MYANFKSRFIYRWRIVARWWVWRWESTRCNTNHSRSLPQLRTAVRANRPLLGSGRVIATEWEIWSACSLLLPLARFSLIMSGFKSSSAPLTIYAWFSYYCALKYTTPRWYSCTMWKCLSQILETALCPCSQRAWLYCPCVEMGLGSKPKEQQGLHPSFGTFFCCCCENTASLFIGVDSSRHHQYNVSPKTPTNYRHSYLIIYS
jgi:hypothetical protein